MTATNACHRPMVTRDSIIAITSPASPCQSMALIKSTVDQIASQYGFSILYGRDNYESLTAPERAEVLLGYLLDDKLDVIWACRGGEGSADLLPILEAHRDVIKQARPKWLVGFSDVTALLFYFYQTYDWPVIHGPTAYGFAHNHCDELSKTELMHCLQDVRTPRVLNEVRCLSSIKEAARIEAPMVAANLTLLTLCIQDLWHADLKGKILVIEEVNEKPHAVWRALKYLSRIGFFSGVQAIIFGDFIPNEAAHDEAMKRVFLQFADEQSFPVFLAPFFGHGESNRPIVFGQRGVLSHDDDTQAWHLLY